MLQNDGTSTRTGTWISFPRGEWLLPAGIVIAAFLLRLALFLQSSTAGRDGALYLSIIEQLQQGGLPVLPEILMERVGRELPPLYLLAVFWITKTGVDVQSAAIGLNLACGALLCAAMYGIAKNCFHSKEAAVAVALLAAVHPGWVELSGSALREPLFLLLTACGILAAQSALLKRRPRRMAAAAGLFLSAALCRYEGVLPLLLLPPVAAAYGVLQGHSRREIAAQPAWYIGSAGVLLTCLLLFCPIIRNYLVNSWEVLTS